MHIIIRIFIIAFMSQYTFTHLLHIEASRRKKAICVFSSFLIALITMPVQRVLSPLMFNTTLVILLIISVKYTWNLSFILSIKTILVSTAISYISLLVLCFIIAPLGATLERILPNGEVSFSISMIIIGMLQFTFFTLLFRVNRLRKGMPFLYENKTGMTLIIISTVVILCITLFSLHQKADWLFLFFSLFLLLSGIGIYLLWRHMIKRTYLNLVREREISNLEDIIKRQKIMIERLEAEHDRLAEIVHRDNKIVPSLIMYTEEIISCPKSSLERLQNIKNDLHKILVERSSNLNMNSNKVFPFSCGISELDAIVNYLINKAYDNNIELSTNIDININDISPTIINTFELSTIIGDLLDNSIHACTSVVSTVTSKKCKLINLSLENIDGCYLIRISDTGIPFDKNVVINLGKIKITSRKKVGGSGIGMFNTIYILKKYRASLCITTSSYEENNISFTKDITIYFDNKNEIRVNHNDIEYGRDNTL